MADIENEGKRAKNKGSKKSSKSSTSKHVETEIDAMDDSGSMTTGIPDANSWRDFITNASAALSGLTEDVVVDNSDELEMAPVSPAAEVGLETPVNHGGDLDDAPTKKKRGKKKSPVDSIDWNSDTKDLEIKESNDDMPMADMAADEDAIHFENLARRVAISVSENANIMTDEPASVPTAMGDDSGEVSEELSAEQLGDEHETTFNMAGEQDIELEGSEIQLEGEITSDDGSEISVVSASDFGMTDETTFEGGAQQLDMLAESEVEEPAQEEEDDFAASDLDLDGEPTASSGLSDVEEFITDEVLISVCESLLFSTDKPVSVATVKQIFKNSNVKSKDVTRAFESISIELANPLRGVTLEEVGGGYQLRTKSDNADYLRRLAKVRPFRLSGPALECMAMVAYKQPITKHEIDEIRGVESGHLLRALMERGLVCFNGKSDLPGKPMTYGSTRKFLETFGLRNLRELPTLSEIDELIPEGIGEVEEKESLSDITDRMSNEIVGTYSEAEDELFKINEQLQAVDTTSEFFEQEKVRERERRDRDKAQDLREKIVMGDDVETKDRRWLDRYEAKLLAAEHAAANPVAEPITGPDGEISMAEANEIAADLTEGDREEAVELSTQLEALTDEPLEISADDEDLDGVDGGWMEQGSTDDEESEDSEDLTARPDWEDDETGEGHSH